jgi:hypothetical protein
MAVTQNIGLRITIGGITEVVTNIRQLEEAISKARERLKGLEIGSTEFKRLTNDIRVAESSLKDLNKAAEGLEFEQKLEAFARVGGAVTSSFAAAQAAVNLFGGDAEKVSEAAAKAQNLLTIALTARSIAEGAAGLKTVALTVKTIAQTAATNASTVATRTLYTVIAANPIGALVTVIGLAVTALLAFSNSSDEAEDSQANLEKSLARVNGELDKQITLLEIQGATQVEVQRVRVTQAERNLEILEDEFVRLQRVSKFSEETEKARIAAQEASNKLDIERARLQRFIDDEEVKNDEERKKRDEQRKQRLQEQLELKKQEIIREQELARAELLRFSQGQEFGGLDITLDLERRITQLQEQADKVVKIEGVIQKARKLSVSISKEDLMILKQLGIETEDFQKTVDNLNKSQKSQMENIMDTINAYAAANPAPIELGKERVQLLEKEQSIYEKLLDSEVLKKIGDEQVKLQTNQALVAQGFIRVNQQVPESFSAIVKAQMDIASGVAFTFDELMKANMEFDNFRKKYVDDYVKANTKLRASDAGYKTEQEELRKTGGAYFDQLVQNQQQVIKYEKSISDINEQFKKLIQTQSDLVSSGKLITGFIAENREEIAKQIDIPLDFINNTSRQLELVQGTLKNVPPIFYKNVEGLGELITDFEKELSRNGIDISKAEYSEKLRLLEEYLKNRQKKEQTAQQKTISDVQRGIQEFQSVLNALAQTTSQYYAFQLDLLAQQSEEIQSKIVGDSKEAVELRLEQEKIYNEKKKQLEKQSAVTALRISLAQALANTAEAITRAFTAGPVVGQIAAGIIAGISASQVALIGSQISQIQSLQRGGMIKGQGGFMVSGPSHEYGGVKFQGGGVELEGGEAVINRVGSIQYGGLLNQINQLSGGRPLTSNTFDDSRIVEAIAKQRSEPIRAYVVEQDITNKQGVTRRLEQLSQI